MTNLLKLNLTQKDNETIAAFRETHPEKEDFGFYAMDLEPVNISDAQEALEKGELEAIVSEAGIIGYAFKGNAEEIATTLTLRAIQEEK